MVSRRAAPSSRFYPKTVHEPAIDHGDDVLLLFQGERAPARNAVPLGKALAAAGGGGVLGDEDRVATHRRLLAVIGGLSGREALSDEVAGMIEYDRETVGFEMAKLGRPKPEAAPEGRCA